MAGDDRVGKAYVRSLVENELAKDLVRADSEFAKVARSARHQEVVSALRFAAIGAAINGERTVPLFARLMIDRNRQIGMSERLAGFSETPLIAIGGEALRVSSRSKNRPKASSVSFGLPETGPDSEP